MTKPKRYKRYSSEFKREAIRRASEESVTDAAVQNSWINFGFRHIPAIDCIYLVMVMYQQDSLTILE